MNSTYRGKCIHILYCIPVCLVVLFGYPSAGAATDSVVFGIEPAPDAQEEADPVVKYREDRDIRSLLREARRLENEHAARQKKIEEIMAPLRAMAEAKDAQRRDAWLGLPGLVRVIGFIFIGWGFVNSLRTKDESPLMPVASGLLFIVYLFYNLIVPIV